MNLFVLFLSNTYIVHTVCNIHHISHSYHTHYQHYQLFFFFFHLLMNELLYIHSILISNKGVLIIEGLKSNKANFHHSEQQPGAHGRRYEPTKYTINITQPILGPRKSQIHRNCPREYCK